MSDRQNGGFGRAVTGMTAGAPDCGGGRYIDYAAAHLSLHRGQYREDHVVCAMNIDVDHGPKCGFLYLTLGVESVDTGVIDQNIDAAKLIDDFLCDRFGVSAMAHVATITSNSLRGRVFDWLGNRGDVCDSTQLLCAPNGIPAKKRRSSCPITPRRLLALHARASRPSYRGFLRDRIPRRRRHVLHPGGHGGPRERQSVEQ